MALVALYQFAARDLFLNNELLDSNQIKPSFRVNSVFFDPNVLGRYLALGDDRAGRGGRVVARRPAGACWATAAGVLMLAGLALSFSITSIAALLAGLGVLALLRYGLIAGRRCRASRSCSPPWSSLLSGGADRSDVGPIRGLDEETSGRGALLEGGFDLIEEEPITGWGSGAFGRAFFDEIRQTETTALALRADHRGRRAGDPRRARLPGPAGRDGRGRCSGPGCVSSAGQGRGRRGRRRADRAQPRLRGLPDRPGDLGAARPGRGVRRLRRPDGERASRRQADELPAAAGDDGRGLHGLERRLEADRGLPAADLHGVPDAAPTTAPPR